MLKFQLVIGRKPSVDRKYSYYIIKLILTPILLQSNLKFLTSQQAKTFPHLGKK